jgi:plastocyanin
MKVLALAALALAGAAVAGVVAQAGPTKSAIRVTEREFKISLSATQAKPGTARFEIKNTGKYPHSLAIAGHGVKARTKIIQPGKSAALVVTLKEGSYSLWCPVPGHAAKGMKASLSVTAVAQGGAGSATTSGGAGGGDTTTDSGVPWG